MYGSADTLASHWRFMASEFGGMDGVLGYELINEPWVGDVTADASLLLPGVAGERNLVRQF